MPKEKKPKADKVFKTPKYPRWQVTPKTHVRLQKEAHAAGQSLFLYVENLLNKS